MGIENIQQQVYVCTTSEGGLHISTVSRDLLGQCWEWRLQGPHPVATPSVPVSSEQFASWLSDLETDGFCVWPAGQVAA